MIRFECPHCRNPLALDEQYAGRDGWCRVCKQMVVVPQPGGPQRLDDLSPEERYGRMQHLLKYAATKADEYKLLLARAQAAATSIVSANQTLEASDVEEERRAQAEEVLALTEELRIVQEQLSAREQKIARLGETTEDDQVDEAGTLRDELETMQELLTESEETVAKLRKESDVAQSREVSFDARLLEQVQELAGLKKTLKSEKNARQDSESDLGVVQQSSIRLIEQLAIPQKKLEDLYARAEEAEARESELASALAKLDTSTIAVLDTAKSDLDGARNEVRIAQAEVAALKDTEKERDRVLSEAVAEVERLGGALKSVEGELEGATADQGEFTTSSDVSQARLDDLNENLEEERKARSEAETGHGQGLDELAGAQETIASLEDTVTALRKELSDAVTLSNSLPVVSETALVAQDESEIGEWATMATHAGEEEVREEQDQMMRTFLRFLEKK